MSAKFSSSAESVKPIIWKKKSDLREHWPMDGVEKYDGRFFFRFKVLGYPLKDWIKKIYNASRLPEEGLAPLIYRTLSRYIVVYTKV